mgnify:CR=1 FL=1
MKVKNYAKVNAVEHTHTKKKIIPDGYPLYPADEDIFNRNKLDENTDPEDVSKQKQPNEKDYDADDLGYDLDVPGSDLDDEDEAIGSEDEENNYYSLASDYNNDLLEDRD